MQDKMIQLLKKSIYKKSLWKNGKGTTSQIAIFPENATIAANDFLWRLSSAEINQSDPFSHFPIYERILIVWKGDGLLLNGSALLPYSPLLFSGEEKINCDLIGTTPVVDVGMIYKKDCVHLSVEIVNLSVSEEMPASLELTAGIHYLFFAKGNSFMVDENIFEVGDCLKIENDKKKPVSFKAHSELIFFHFAIKTIKD